MKSFFQQHADPRQHRKKNLFPAIDALFEKINFKSKSEAILPENVELTKQAFIDFYQEQDLLLPLWAFQDTLADCRGEFEHRADGETPNWYHQTRQIMYRLAKIRSGVMKLHHWNGYGGLQVALTVDYDHDRWEDLGISKTSIFASREKRIHELWDKNPDKKPDAFFFMLRQQASMAADFTDFMTRKTPRMDADGNYVRKENGKLQKDDRFLGSLDLYMDEVLKTPITIDGKYNDGIEGMSTRHVSPFTAEQNRSYAEERRRIYGRRDMEHEAIDRFPFMKKAIRSSDDVLGVLLMMTETVVDYSKPENNPRFARPMNIKPYLDPQMISWVSLLGPAWNPITIALEDLENKAKAEEKPHTGIILANAIYPAIPASMRPHNYVDRGTNGAVLLPNGSVYAPNMQ